MTTTEQTGVTADPRAGRSETYLITLPACPFWCESPAGHGFTEQRIEDGAPYRQHEANLGFAFVTQGEALVGETLTREPAFIGVDSLVPGTVLTAAEARAMAASLTMAADTLDSIPTA